MATIPVAVGLAALAPSALGQDAYVANRGSNSVSVIDTQSNEVVGSPITVGEWPDSIAITPDGKTAYVANGRSDSVSVIDTQTNEVVSSPIMVGEVPSAIAVTPNGRRAYVTDAWSNSVSVIDTQTNEVVGSPITVDREPGQIAVAPDGTRAYFTDYFDGRVSQIDTQIDQLVGPLEELGEPNGIIVGSEPTGIAISPNGKTVYVANSFGEGVSVIDTETNNAIKKILDGGNPFYTGGGVAFSPNGQSAYVVESHGGGVREIDTETNEVVGSQIRVGEDPDAIAITPEASNSGGKTTSAPSIEDEAATNVLPRDATLSAKINPEGLETSYQFHLLFGCFSSHAACQWLSEKDLPSGTIPVSSEAQSVSVDLAGSGVKLQPGWEYKYWVVATNEQGEESGPVQSFTTPTEPISIHGEWALHITPTDATLMADIRAPSGGRGAYYQFQIDSEASEFAAELLCPSKLPPASDGCDGASSATALPIGYVSPEPPPGSVSLDLASAAVPLQPGTTYHYRVIAAPAAMTEGTIQWEAPPSLGGDQSFTTPSGPPHSPGPSDPDSPPGPLGSPPSGSPHSHSRRHRPRRHRRGRKRHLGRHSG